MTQKWFARLTQRPQPQPGPNLLDMVNATINHLADEFEDGHRLKHEDHVFEVIGSMVGARTLEEKFQAIGNAIQKIVERLELKRKVH